MNKVILSGEVVRDAEYRVTTNGNKMTKFTIKADSTWESNGDILTSYTYANCVYWGEPPAFHAGDTVSVEGRLSIRSYEKDEQKRYVTQIVVDKFIEDEDTPF